MTSFRLLMALFAGAGAAACWPGFLALAPNRLTTSVPVSLFTTAPMAGALVAASLVVLAVSAWRNRPALALSAGVALLLATILAAGTGAAALLRHATGPAARAQLSTGFWLLLMLAALTSLTALAALHWKPWRRLAVLAAIMACLALMQSSGVLHGLSIAQEFRSHQAAFWAAASRHVLLVAITLAGALTTGIPAGLAAWKHPRWRPSIFATLNVIQTVPSVALFGLLMAPLTRLGLSAIGLVPACIALVLYALLPTARAIVSGLDGVPVAPVQAAAGLGLSPTQIFWQLRLPLAAPTLLAGLRIVTVQSVGLAVVAALIGAGGFGDFVFQGLGQYATDLVLLGALPATALALGADAALSLAAETARRRAA